MELNRHSSSQGVTLPKPSKIEIKEELTLSNEINNNSISSGSSISICVESIR
jgi:hypothetical protein